MMVSSIVPKLHSKLQFSSRKNKMGAFDYVSTIGFEQSDGEE